MTDQEAMLRKILSTHIEDNDSVTDIINQPELQRFVTDPTFSMHCYDAMNQSENLDEVGGFMRALNEGDDYIKIAFKTNDLTPDGIKKLITDACRTLDLALNQ